MTKCHSLQLGRPGGLNLARCELKKYPRHSAYSRLRGEDIFMRSLAHQPELAHHLGGHTDERKHGRNDADDGSDIAAA